MPPQPDEGKHITSAAEGKKKDVHGNDEWRIQNDE
jgi:hypothetical protein